MNNYKNPGKQIHNVLWDAKERKCRTNRGSETTTVSSTFWTNDNNYHNANVVYAKNRVMNRCQITGRPHGVYRKLKISRIALRQLGLQGKIPGLVKSSW